VISIDWQQVIGSILIGGSGLGGAIWAAIAGWKKFRPSAKTGTADRAADDLPPAGSVDWAVDICEAMGAASAETKLKAILGGATRDDARKLRIAELEAKP
jgi:hypothetical protein